MAGLTNDRFIMNFPRQLRFKCTEGSPRYAADGLARIFNKGEHNIRFIEHYIPKHESRTIICKFETDEDREKAENLPELDAYLTRFKCVRHRPAPGNSVEKALRTIFIWNLSPVYFYTYTRRDGHHIDETIQMKKDQLLQDLKERLQPRDMDIIDHHFIGHIPNTPPRILKLTFRTPEQAKKFNEEDTRTSLGILLKGIKKFE